MPGLDAIKVRLAKQFVGVIPCNVAHDPLCGANSDRMTVGGNVLLKGRVFHGDMAKF